MSANRLQPRDEAPDFEMEDCFGNPIRLHDYRGQRLLLTFFRFATCPLCNLRIARMMHEYPSYEGRLTPIAVFQSRVDYIREYIGERRRPPFPIVADPEGELYRRYFVAFSWWKTLTGMLNLREMIPAFRAIDYPFKPSFMVGGRFNRVPADFLIAADGRIVNAYYGRDITDHIPFSAINEFVGLSSNSDNG